MLWVAILVICSGPTNEPEALRNAAREHLRVGGESNPSARYEAARLERIIKEIEENPLLRPPWED